MRSIPMGKILKRVLPALFGLCLLAGSGAQSATDSVGQALDALTETRNAAAKSQLRIDALVKDARSLHEQARQADSEAEQLRAYIAELEHQVQSQEQQKTALRQQIATSSGSAPALGPLLKQMIDALDRFVSGDLPFLQAERKRRVAELRAQMEKPDQGMSAKLRAVIEDYQVEILYGRTLETYPGQLSFGKTTLPVDFLRVGRLMLFYRSNDGTRAGYWDRAAQHWHVLDEDESPRLEHAIQVVQGGSQPELLELPMPVAQGER